VSKHATGLTQLRDLPDEELRQALGRTRDELFRLQLGQYTNQVTSTAALTTKRRDVARILTILRGRQLGNETQAQKAATQGTAKAAPKAKRTATKTQKATKAKS
jgi:large subunit ribosomal protein L29